MWSLVLLSLALRRLLIWSYSDGAREDTPDGVQSIIVLRNIFIGFKKKKGKRGLEDTYDDVCLFSLFISVMQNTNYFFQVVARGMTVTLFQHWGCVTPGQYKRFTENADSLVPHESLSPETWASVQGEVAAYVAPPPPAPKRRRRVASRKEGQGNDQVLRVSKRLQAKAGQ